MSFDIRLQGEKLIKAKLRQKRWRQIVGALAAVVVFVTTYALVLPAITMEREASCGLEEHVHTDECYTVSMSEAKTELICTKETLEIHKHTKACYDDDNRLICGYADFIVHTHDERCYDASGKLICTLPEVKEHVHDNKCYDTDGSLLCEKEEISLHKHTKQCYDKDGTLICGKLEVLEHQHTDECFKTTESEEIRTLTCGLEEHKHTEACYPQEEEAQTSQEYILTATTPEGVKVVLTGPAASFDLPLEELSLSVNELFQKDEAAPTPLSAEPDGGVDSQQEERAASAFETMDCALQEQGVSPTAKRLFDIRLMQGDVEIQPVGPVTLTFSGIDSDEPAVEAKVYHIDEAENLATDMPAALIEDGSVEVQTTHFSLYGVVLTAGESLGIDTVWSTGSAPSGASVVLELRKNGVTTETITMNSATGWSVSRSGLPAGEYTLFLISSNPAGYSGSIANTTDSNGIQRFIITMTAYATGDLTVNVTKTWAGGTDGAASATFALLADGQRFTPDRTITVNAAGSWKGSFTNLPEKDGAGNTISYSVYELPISGWVPSMVETTVAGAAGSWVNVPTSGFTVGTVYRLVINPGEANARALAWTSGSSLAPAVLSDTDTAQQWKWVSGNYLQNVKDPSRYIRIQTSILSGNSVTAESTPSSLAQNWSSGTVRLYITERILFFDISYYINMSTSGVSVTPSNGTAFTAQTYTPAVAPSDSIAVTNHPVSSPEPNLTFPHYKQIDSLSDGVANPDTTLSGIDFSRLYLDGTTKPYPIDLVLVVDRSTSMSYDANGTAFTNDANRRDVAVAAMLNGSTGDPGFIERFLSLNEDNNLSIVWFGGQSSSPQQTSLRNVTESGTVTGWIQTKNYTVAATGGGTNVTQTGNIGYLATNGTNYMAGMWAAADMLRSNAAIAANGHKKMVVFLTDGAPTFYVNTSASDSTTGATYANYTAWKNASRPASGINALYRRGTGSDTTLSATPSINAFTDFKTNNPGVVFSSIMFAPSSTDQTVLDTMLANGGTVQQTQGVENLAALFANTVSALTSSKNFSITDNLSQYVQWYAPQPDLIITRKNINSTDPATVIWQSTGAAVSGTIGAPTAANTVTQNGVSMNIIDSVIYTPSNSANSTGTVQVLFNQDFEVDNENKYTLSFNVKTTAAAYGEFADTGYNATGDVSTDYSTNTSSSTKAGFFSNQSATLKYRYNNVFYEESYSQPVIQVTTADLSIHKTNIDGSESLQGTEFELYSASVPASGTWSNASETPYAAGTTGSGGTLTLSNLIPGQYLLYETAATEGYRKPDEPWQVTVSAGGVLSISGLTAGGDGVYTIANASMEAQLVAEKLWLDPDGTAKTEGLPDEIEVELWRKWETSDSGGGDGTVTAHDELVAPVTLNAAGEWKYEWNTLDVNDPGGNPYSYYVKEIIPDGYAVSYFNNGGITGGLITITNQTSYVLPDSGGGGTLPYTVAGVLMLSAGLMYIKRKFRKGGRESP